MPVRRGIQCRPAHIAVIAVDLIGSAPVLRQLAIGDCIKKVFSTSAMNPSTGNLVISARSGDREDAIHSVCKDDIVVYLVQFNVRGTVSLGVLQLSPRRHIKQLSNRTPRPL